MMHNVTELTGLGATAKRGRILLCMSGKLVFCYRNLYIFLLLHILFESYAFAYVIALLCRSPKLQLTPYVRVLSP